MLEDKLQNLNKKIKEEKQPKFIKDSNFIFFVLILVMFFVPLIYILSESQSFGNLVFWGLIGLTLVLLVVLGFYASSGSLSTASEGSYSQSWEKQYQLCILKLKSLAAEERLEGIVHLNKLAHIDDAAKRRVIADMLLNFLRSMYLQIPKLTEEDEKDEVKKKAYYDRLYHRNEYKSQASKALKLALETYRFAKQRVNLSDFYLGGLDLNFFNFSYAILNKTNFEGSDLFLAKFKGADLFMVNFSDCNLCMAGLELVQLEGVSLKNANLSDAKLYGSNLSKVSSTLNTNFTGAKYNSIPVGEYPATIFPKDLESKETRALFQMLEDNIAHQQEQKL